MIATSTVPTPCGTMVLGAIDGKVCMCDWLCSRVHGRVVRQLAAAYTCSFEESPCDILNEAERQLHEYFAGLRTAFALPVSLSGTVFRRSVWDALRTIPYGHTVSYAAVAAAIGRQDAVRAVANAVGANPLSIIIPCHRVVGSSGNLTGYAGGLDAKRHLLALEAAVRVGNRIKD